MRGQQKDLATEFFDKSDRNAVGFEIALAAFLATAVLTYPTPDYAILGEISAFALLFLTLVRRVALASPFAPEKKVMNLSVVPIELATTSSLIYLFSSFIHRVPLANFGVRPLDVFVLVVLSIVIISVVLQELIFRDYLAWWYAKFETRAGQSDYWAGIWKDIAAISYIFSQARRNRDSYRKLRDRLQGTAPNPDEFDVGPRQYLKMVSQSLVLAILLYGLPVGYSLYSVGLVGVGVVAAVVAIHDHSCFWYIAYGNTSYEDFRKPVWSIILLTLLYVTEVSALIGS